jgi:hypothetical protein
MTTMPKVASATQSPQNLKDLRLSWSKAITMVDRHALSCKGCRTPRNPHNFAVVVGSLTDPTLERYRPCRIAEALYKAERDAMAAYRAVGDLPAY